MQLQPDLRSSLLAGRSVAERRRLVSAFTDAWETGVLSPERIQTGCLFEGHSVTSYSFAVLRIDPRHSMRRHQTFDEWYPEFAPTRELLDAYRHKDKHGQRRIQWLEFALRYLAELDALPTDAWSSFIAQLNDMPSRYTTVTLLGCEHPTAADEGRVRCHRRLLRVYLLGQVEMLPELCGHAA